MYIIGMYTILFILSVLATYILIKNVSNTHSSYYVALFALVTVVCVAYTAYSMANDAGMALVANQFTYFDGTFVLTFFLFCVLDICDIKVNSIIRFLLVALALFFLVLAFTTGETQIFYKSVEFETYKGSSHLVMEFGPLHKWFLVYVVLNALSPLVFIIYSIFHRKKISYKYTTALGLLEIAIVGIYFVEEALELGFDILPCGYVLMEYVILGIIHRIALYDGSQIVVLNSEDRKEYGYIIFDTNKAYVGSNKVAKYFFPEIETLYIDSVPTNEFIVNEFVNRIDEAALNDGEYKTYNRNGRIVICTVKPYMPGSKNKVYGYIIEIRDDTKQQQMIKTLNEVNSDLETAVYDANSANRAKSDFLASMSHEIRTPINAILGMNEIALRECENPKLTAYLEDIKNAGNNLLFIINDILDFSKIEAGKVEIIESEYELSKLIKDVRDLISVKAIEKGLDLFITVDENLPVKVIGDENRIRQIIVNILNNAVKYTPQGSVSLNVKSDNQNSDIVQMEISVSDTGIGIKEEDIPVLFESFSRVDEKKNKSIEGTGLGLAITHRLVSMMNGDIDVTSVYGKGTTFKVTLPQKIADISPIGNFDNYCKKSDLTTKENSMHVDASNMTILVVDDSKVNLAVAKGLLKVTKAQVDTCQSGAACLEMIAKKHYDVVLLDHMMPEMDGIETLHKAKEMEDNMCENSAYIVLTANAISGVRELFINEGFDDYISKPIDSKILEDVIARYNH